MATSDNETEEDGLSQAIGLMGTLGAVFSYLLVYIFRLGEAMRYRFDPSLITVSINDFLTVLIPIAAFLVYLLAVSLVIRDLDQSAQRERRRAARRASHTRASEQPAPNTPVTQGVLRSSALSALAYALPHALAWAALSALCPDARIPASALLGAIQCTTVFWRIGSPARNAHAKSASHPKTLRLSPTREELSFATISLCVLPLWLTLTISAVQSSAWLCFVAAALISLGILAALLGLALRVSPLAWSYEVVRRGGRGLNDRPTKTAPVVGALLAAVLALFLLAGYTNQLDFTGSHSLVLSNEEAGTDYAVLALFDGNRAVVRTATPTPANQSAADGDAVGETYAIDLSEPYQVVYLTDGYQVLQANGITVNG